MYCSHDESLSRIFLLFVYIKLSVSGNVFIRLALLSISPLMFDMCTDLSTNSTLCIARRPVFSPLTLGLADSRGTSLLSHIINIYKHSLQLIMLRNCCQILAVFSLFCRFFGQIENEIWQWLNALTCDGQRHQQRCIAQWEAAMVCGGHFRRLPMIL